MNQIWSLKAKPPDEIVNTLMKDVHLPISLATILAQRNINSYDEAKTFFRPKKENLHNPFLMKDMEVAVGRIKKAIESGENILIYGDYDVDGTTAVSMMYDFIYHFTKNVSYYIPDRYTEGYGISKQGIDFASDNDFSLIIALDCGIKAVDKVAYAKTLGIDFIICDHHLPGEKIPEAVAVLNPKQEDCNYPFKELCGCGVGFKLIQALAKSLNLDEEKVFSYLDLSAISIASDIVPIVGENRILTYFGLEEIKKNARPGINALISESQKQNFSVSDIVFYIAPKINAAGRIDHANSAVKLILSENEEKAKIMEKSISELNLIRKEKDEKITSEAIQQITQNQQENNYSTIVYNPHWHRGVLGIAASRLIETFYKPTIVFADDDQDMMVASARSIKGFDIHDALEKCAHLLERFGGHKYAAGLSIHKNNFEEFKLAFEEIVKKSLGSTQKKPVLEIDYKIDFEEINSKFLNILNQMEPFGPQNMTPVFLTENLTAKEVKQMGKSKTHLRMIVHQSDLLKFPAVGFGMGKFYDDFKTKSFDIAFSINKNNWKGKNTYQLNLKDVNFH